MQLVPFHILSAVIILAMPIGSSMKAIVEKIHICITVQSRIGIIIIIQSKVDLVLFQVRYVCKPISKL